MPLALSHIPQRQQTDCLVACTAMVLRYLHIPFDYDQLLQRFGTTSAGTPFSHWQTQNTEHAVVVVGIEQDDVSINDPALDQAPQVVNQHAFLAAWGDRDYEFAVIGLEEFDSPDSAVASS